MMPIKNIVLYTADPWESAMCVLRVRGPARLAGINVIQGNQGDQIAPERVSDADVVIIQRDFPRFVNYDAVIARARNENKLVIYEVDDLILEVPPNHVSYLNYIDMLIRVLSVVVGADAVVTSTELLRDYLAQFNPNVWLVPNLLDDSIWSLKPPWRAESNPQPVVIGYMGGGSHLPDLEMVVPVISRLLEHYGDKITFRFWGVQPPAKLLEYKNVEWHPLALLDYSEFAHYFVQQECDFFIAPLVDNFFNRSKSKIKFLEYSALGIAGIYSRLEPYTGVVSDGEDGLLAGTLDEWEAGLHRLINSPDLRFALAKEAQEAVQRNWLLSGRYHEWVAAYHEMLQHREELDPRRSPQTQTFMRIFAQIETNHQILQRQIEELRGFVGDIQRQLIDSEQRAIVIETELNDKENQLAESEKQLSETKAQLDMTEQRSQETERRLTDSINSLYYQLRDREVQLEHVYQSRSWRTGSALARIFRAIFPKKVD